MSPEEKELHRRFLRLFTAHESAIRAYVRRLVPVRSDADDIMQDVSIVLWDKFGDFREGGDFRAWSFGVARFEVLAWRRDRARDRLVLDETVVERLATESIEREPLLSEQRKALESCLGKIDAKERALLLEAYGPDNRIRKVAEKSGRSIGGFYQWLHRMRASLLDCIRRTLESGEISS